MFFFGCMFIGILWLLFIICNELFLNKVILIVEVCFVSVLFILLLIIFCVKWFGCVVLVYIFGCLCIGLRLFNILMDLDV